MLVALSIRSFVLIDRLDLEAGQGFTALTGETGAGKSIILDALDLVLGGQANRGAIRKGSDQASISAEFAPPSDHEIWACFREHGLEIDPDEALVFRRTIAHKGPSRAFINGQSVSVALLGAAGRTLVEIHGQHAASGLMRPSTHRGLLDAFAGHQALLETCAKAWDEFELAVGAREALEQAAKSARERQDWLEFAVEDLSKLSPDDGEADQLTAQRGALLQSEKIAENIQDARSAITTSAIEDNLAKTARATERLLRLEGLNALDNGISGAIEKAAEAVERALIEVAEAQACVIALSDFAGDDTRVLDDVEARLFALRAAGRKYECDPNQLGNVLNQHRAALELCLSDTSALEAAKQAEADAEATWKTAASRLTRSRKKAAEQLEAAIMMELEPLHLGRVSVRVGFEPIGANESGAAGGERAEFQVETNPGSGFGPLRSIASGGELARFSLALKCALSQTGGAETLIFDEADQGVGGAVAAAIGERLARLSEQRQVFAITHSPQVASSGKRQWRVRKTPDESGALRTHIVQLDEGERLEEIARMLSGSSITDEARAAASKLLEVA
ncbi:MAG: DNA repair protein RecN [Henriciella sp.]|nr:DNA repair protein RecN [Henriciella sp.]